MGMIFYRKTKVKYSWIKIGELQSVREPATSTNVFLVEQVKAGEVSIKQYPTDYMVVEYFTKTLQGENFRKFRDTTLNMKYGLMIDYKISIGVC